MKWIHLRTSISNNADHKEHIEEESLPVIGDMRFFIIREEEFFMPYECEHTSLVSIQLPCAMQRTLLTRTLKITLQLSASFKCFQSVCV